MVISPQYGMMKSSQNRQRIYLRYIVIFILELITNNQIYTFYCKQNGLTFACLMFESMVSHRMTTTRGLLYSEYVESQLCGVMP